MRILIVSTMNLPTPPVGYGGIERVVHAYAEALVRAGHEVVLIGRRGSLFSGRVVIAEDLEQATTTGGAVRLDEEPLYNAVRDTLAHWRPDVLHDWSLKNLFVNRRPKAVPFLVSTCIPQPADYAQRNVVAGSAAHAATLKGIKPNSTIPFVHFGLDLDAIRFEPKGGRRLVQIAKIARYKGQHRAMAAAVLARQKLDIVGNVEGRRYHRLVVAPMAKILPGMALRGETQDPEAVLRGALALVQAPLWFEVFPYVSLQAMAVGTPLITLAAGGCAEQVEPGVNGYVAKNFGEFFEAMGNIAAIDRRRCRALAEERFHVHRMVSDYLRLFERVRQGECW